MPKTIPNRNRVEEIRLMVEDLVAWNNIHEMIDIALLVLLEDQKEITKKEYRYLKDKLDWSINSHV